MTRAQMTRTRTAHAAGRRRAGGASGGQVCVRVIVRASGRQRGSVRVCGRIVVSTSGRQRGSTVRGSVQVRERVVVSASGQAARAVRKSRDEIRLG